MSWLLPLKVSMPPKVVKLCTGGKPPKKMSLELNRKIWEMHNQGLQKFQIAERLKVSRSTVGKHLLGKRKFCLPR